MAFKHSQKSKNISSAGIKQFSSPPVNGKANGLSDKQGMPFQNGNISINIAVAPLQNLNTNGSSIQIVANQNLSIPI